MGSTPGRYDPGQVVHIDVPLSQAVKFGIGQ